MSSPDDWRLVSSHGAALLFIVARPESTISEIAIGLGLTERSAWTLVLDLRRAGMLRTRRERRRHRYTVELDASFELPSLGVFHLRDLVGQLAMRVSDASGHPAKVA
jgi:DNA-binding IclR family transcriptional regulator